MPYILLIDDDEDDLEVLSSALKNRHIVIKTFDSTAKAIFYLMNISGTMQMPSLIITDYNMPKNNGYDLLLSVKSNNNTKHIPVVVYSATISDRLKEQLARAGAFDCLNKPWTNKEFDSHVQQFQNLFLYLASGKKSMQA
jgi:two-component system chemotaxis response regulator CheY